MTCDTREHRLRERLLTTQLILGPARTGAPLHHHGTALNLNLMGTKRWMLLPQRDGAWSNAPVADWDPAVRLRKVQRSLLLECTQRAGDVVFVPALYSHGVLNMAPSIAVSFLGTFG